MVNPRERLYAAENRTEWRSYPWLWLSHNAKVQKPEKELQSSVSLTRLSLLHLPFGMGISILRQYMSEIHKLDLKYITL